MIFTKKMSNLTKLLLCIIGVLLCWLIIIIPLLGIWDSMREDGDSLERQYVRYLRLMQLRGKADTVSSGLCNRAYAKKSDEEEKAFFLKQVEEAALKAGLKIEDIKPLPHTAKDGFLNCMIDVEMNGLMDNVVKFIYEMVENQSFIKIDRLTITAADRGSEETKVSFSLTKSLLL